MKAVRRTAGMCAALGLVAVGACGDGGGGGSFDDISSAVAMPTGTVDKSTAPMVAEAFEQASLGGSTAKHKQLKQNIPDEACGSSGTISTDASGNENNARADIRLNNCCDEPGCCQNGRATVYYSLDAGDDFGYCADYDITLDCGDASGDVQYEYCFSGDALAGLVYVVRIDGLSFAVSGNYSNGSGSLEIRGENGSFSCTFSETSGSCTGSGGSFDF